MRLYMRVGSSSSKATAAGIALACAFMVLAGCGGSGESATDAAAPVIRGDGATTSPSASIRTVTFNASGGTGTMASQSASSATALSLNTFAYPGYVFDGWATKTYLAAAYADGASYPFTANATLYAKWSAPLTFDANGGTGNMPSPACSIPTLPTNTFTRSGYVFDGWATSSGGAKVSDDGDATPVGCRPPEGLTLYARWNIIPTDKTVTFDANGGTGTMASQTASTSTALTSNAFTRSGYVFDGWSTTPDGAKEYPNTGKYPFTESDTLYARWKCCVVTFNANGGTGTMPSQTASTATALTANTFTKDNFTFEGWKNAGSTLLDRAVYAFDEPATLKAQWKCLPYDPFYGEIFTLTAKRVSNNAATVQLGVRGAGGVSGWKKFKATSYDDFDNGDNQTQSTTVTSDTWGDWPPIIRVTGLDKGKKYVFQVLGTTESGCTYQSQVSNSISKW